MMAKSIVGDLIGKRNIVYAPINRAGVLGLFCRLLDEFDMLLEETAADCGYVIARRRVDNGWERVKINLAYRSSEFSDGNPEDGDLLICWHHDWPGCPLKAFELKALFENDNQPTTPASPQPAVDRSADKKNEANLSDIMPDDSAALLANRAITIKRFEKAIGDLDDKIKNFFPERS
jgi:hypothetical protein